MEIISYYKGSTFGKLTKEEKREALEEALNIYGKEDSLFSIFSDRLTVITGFIDIDEESYPISVFSNIVKIKDLFRICFPLFYDSFKKVDKVTLLFVTKNGKFEDYEDNEFGISIDTNLISSIINSSNFDIEVSKNIANMENQLKNFISFMKEIGCEMNYSKESKTFESIENELKEKQSYLEIHRKKYVNKFKIEYDENTNEYKITDISIPLWFD